jgi:V8-like Glu-specific endopeptidase
MAPSEPVLSHSQRLWFATLITSLLLLILVVSCGGCMVPNHTPEGVPTMSDPSVAKLVKVVDGETAGFCTVFKVVGNDLAMTAGHCCGSDDDDGASAPAPTEEDDINKIFDQMIKDLQGVSAQVAKKVVTTYHATGPHAVPGAEFTVLVDDDKHDVCVMRGKMRGAPLALAAHDPPVGSRVWTAGFPKTVFLISDGVWSGRQEDEDNEGIASTSVWGGASGSPVMDSNGRVIGILRAYYPPMDTMSVIAPIEWLRAAYMQVR